MVPDVPEAEVIRPVGRVDHDPSAPGEVRGELGGHQRGEAEQGGSVAGRLPQNFGAQVGTTFRQLPRTIQATFSAVALAPGWGSVEVQPVMLTSPTSRRPTSSTRWACARTRTRIACSWSCFP